MRKSLRNEIDSFAHGVVMGLNPDLDDAMKIQCVGVSARGHRSLTKGIHGMIPKAIFRTQ
jgi:hypothetical protein